MIEIIDDLCIVLNAHLGNQLRQFGDIAVFGVKLRKSKWFIAFATEACNE
jgi:hypothetical protein